MRRDNETGFLSFRHRDCLSGMNNCTVPESSVQSGGANNSRTTDTQSRQCEPEKCIPGVLHKERCCYEQKTIIALLAIMGTESSADGWIFLVEAWPAMMSLQDGSVRFI
jgi:hypothetical protein